MILELRVLHFEDLSVGMTETFSKTIASSDVVGFAQLTGDRNPIHLSEHFAAKTQFGKRIDRKSTRLNSSHLTQSRMPSSA